MFLLTANNVAFAIVTSCIMYLLTLSETVDATSVVNFTAFTRHTDFNQSECPEGDKVFSKDVKWLIRCLRLCANEKSCRTVLYDDLKCNGCTDTYTMSQETVKVSDRITHYQKTPDTYSFFIGISDCQVDGVWKDSATGNYATFLDFQTQPANGNISTCCVVYSKWVNYKWAGFACTDKTPRTICEKPLN